MNSEKIGVCFFFASFSSDFRTHHFSAVVKAKASSSFQLLHNKKKKQCQVGEEQGEEGTMQRDPFSFIEAT